MLLFFIIPLECRHIVIGLFVCLSVGSSIRSVLEFSCALNKTNMYGRISKNTWHGFLPVGDNVPCTRLRVNVSCQGQAHLLQMSIFCVQSITQTCIGRFPKQLCMFTRWRQVSRTRLRVPTVKVTTYMCP